MKITAFLLFCFIGSIFADNSYSQATKLTLHLTDATIEEVLSKIEDGSEFYFLFNHKLIDVNRKVDIEADNEPIKDILNEILNDDVNFLVYDRQIVLTPKDQAMDLMAFQQQKLISGTVADKNGNPLPGVNVVVTGTTIGAITDNAGRYNIEVTQGANSLTFSFIGMELQEINIGDQTQINVTMVESAIGLEEVVVTALGIKREKKSIGYAVGDVDGKAINNVAQTNLMTAIAAKVPGVSINSSGSGINSSVDMTIRGMRSLNNDNQPLFVIDGVPVQNQFFNFASYGNGNLSDFGNALTDINPGDIENISILKGPSAAALYGSRAGNGVVLITTKSGSRQTGLGVTVSTNTVIDNPYKYFKEFNSYAGGVRGVLDESVQMRTGPALDQGLKAVQWNSPLDENGVPTATELKAYDNIKNFLQSAIISTNDFSIENKSDKFNYRLSYNNMSSRGVVPNTDLFRNGVGTNATFRPRSNFSVSAAVTFVHTNSNNVGGREEGLNPLDAVARLSPHIDVRELKDYWYIPGREQRLAVRPELNTSKLGTANNPYFIANELSNAFERNHVIGNVKLDWDFFKDFHFMARYALSQLNEDRETKVPYSTSSMLKGGYNISSSNSLESNSDFLLSYAKKSDIFSFNASAGGNIMYSKGRGLYSGTKGVDGLAIPNLYSLGNISSTEISYSQSFGEKIIYSLYGTTSIGFKDAAYLDLTARNDWSSTLPESNRSYFYPSASLSILLNNFISMGDKVDLFKLRGGIAQVGKDTNPYQITPLLNVGNFNNMPTMYLPSALPNTLLKPELAKSIEGGIDIVMFKNRLRFEGTVYQSDNTNQIMSIPVPTETGYTSRIINSGNVRSHGYELLLGGNIISTKDLVWDISANFTRNRSYIKELAPGIPYILYYYVGVARWMTYTKGEIIPSTGEVSDGLLGSFFDSGILTVKDKASPYYGWPVLGANGKMQAQQTDIKDRVKFGNSQANFTMGFQSSVTFKSFTLSASIDWRNGGEFASFTERRMSSNVSTSHILTNSFSFFDENGAPTTGTVAGTGQTVPEILKADPDKYIIPQNKIQGIPYWVGGAMEEYGGYPYVSNGITYNDGCFIAGVRQTGTNPDGTPIYTENLGGPGTVFVQFRDAWPGSWFRNSMYEADFVKLREIALDWQVPKSMLGDSFVKNISIGIFSRNILLWTKNKWGLDPELAYDIQTNASDFTSDYLQGVDKFNVIYKTLPIGFKLNINF